MIQDPTAGSLLMKKLQAGLSPELAALSVMESSTRPAPDLFREILEWLETKNTSEHEPFFVEGLERGDFNEEDLESLVSKKE